MPDRYRACKHSFTARADYFDVRRTTRVGKAVNRSVGQPGAGIHRSGRGPVEAAIGCSVQARLFWRGSQGDGASSAAAAATAAAAAVASVEADSTVTTATNHCITQRRAEWCCPAVDSRWLASSVFGFLLLRSFSNHKQRRASVRDRPRIHVRRDLYTGSEVR